MSPEREGGAWLGQVQIAPKGTEMGEARSSNPRTGGFWGKNIVTPLPQGAQWPSLWLILGWALWCALKLLEPRGRLSSSPLVAWKVACQLALPPPLVLLQGWVLLINVKIGDLKKGLGNAGDLQIVLVLTWGKEGMDGSTLMKRGDLCIS